MDQTSRVIARMWELRPTLTGTAITVGLAACLCLLSAVPVAWALAALTVGTLGITATAYAEIRRENTERAEEDENVDSA